MHHFMSAGTSEYNSMNVTDGPILQLYLIRYTLELMISAKIVSVMPLVYSVYTIFCPGNVSGLYLTTYLVYIYYIL